ncbi:tautomerase family protein [Rhizobium sp. VS19-DR104.2]|uniref:tautomerase family protein n=1 Tax=unclassified Rhizobium TaxID=2613769 RepID=UPI001CC4E354|nr:MULTISPECIES: tautomerase family protein [unclassified Rhizobium]MBZ5763033.1 tautomerase family protein [Rhizobium sp. VS19-DR96]MBZ5768812.1 tautomerase family protein [Rhizobium sp. VS19-DR129.2]MBZ5776341.1 tautomerase family protein [Rhizobium sp. VS19-DRK62.2]MBZ5787549.1 tautomerase family protein [Rhizobium sp. VS19-DR121]MBZ5804904.1 tautomerase family protein [Rhizobium sp. VS19-DR181]
MPHVIVKLASGRTEEQKTTLALRLTQAVREVMGSSEDDISAAVEDVLVADWVEKVYVPEIQGRPELIYKKPGYDPFK